MSLLPGWGASARQLEHYPAPGARRRYLALVVLITVALYYALYVGGGVTPLVMRDLRISFEFLVGTLALGNAIGAFASLLAGLSDRFGRASLVVWGLLIVALLTAFGMPVVHDRTSWAALGLMIGFVEGVILVATPALIRDFSPQVGRATAMGFWTVGPVLGSLLTSAVVSATLPSFTDWRMQYRFCGAFALVVFVLAFVFLRELKPALRDQVMVNERDRVRNEMRARGLDVEAALRNPWRQMLRLDIVASALGVSLLLLVYYSTVAFGVIFLVTVYGFTPAGANSLLNFSWAANAVALIVAGVWSDWLRVRKPFMLAGGLGSAALIWIYLAQPVAAPSFTGMVVVASAISVMMGGAYATWMASFTETIEAHNPALTATGLAIWGWLLRLVVTASFLALPHVVTTTTVLLSGTAPPEAMLAAVHAAPGEWRSWYAICALGALAFVALTFSMKGRWSPRAARADEAAHDAALAAER